MFEEFANHPLTLTLDFAVPIWILNFQNGQKDLQNHTANISEILGEHGDALLYKVEGETARAFNACAEGIAVCAFAPGGITIFGRHWEAHMPDDPAYDPQRPWICEKEV